ncbi:MAG: hypothetical protein AB7J35_03535 [Dehalococcoidia bacterium]
MPPAAASAAPAARGTAHVQRTVAVPEAAPRVFEPTAASAIPSEPPAAATGASAGDQASQPGEIRRSAAVETSEATEPSAQRLAPTLPNSTPTGTGPVAASTSPSAAPAQRAPAATASQPAQRLAASGAPAIQRVTAAAMPPPPLPAPIAVHAVPAAIQRTSDTPEATGQITGVQEDSSVETTDYRIMAEKVWPYFQRKIRAERERERGLG